ncbi:MAG: metalloregulator ArsR/SmtB family transcription factor [Pseudomonadota bacterium]
MAYGNSDHTGTAHPYATALEALADPTRRAIVERLSAAPAPVGVLAAGLPVSRPAVSQHLKVLGAAGLVISEPRGARRIYRLAPKGLAPLRDYLDTLWDDALAAFAAEAHRASASDWKDSS